MDDDDKTFRQWDGQQWFGEGGTGPSQVRDIHWNKFQWVGDRGGRARGTVAPEDLPEGERGLSGNRHNPGVQHWASIAKNGR